MSPLLPHRNRRPVKQHCPGPTNGCILRLTTLLWDHLSYDFESLEQTFQVLSTALSDWGRLCIMCGEDQAPLRRATICRRVDCENGFTEAPLEILLADLWLDPPAADLLLASVYAAASGDNLSLLPKLPTHDIAMVVRTLQKLPEIPALAQHLSTCQKAYPYNFSLERALDEYCEFTLDSARLARCLLWTCNSYRGYLTSANRSQQIPWFGDRQFLLVNSAPELEAPFSRHLLTCGTQSEILFHGTSMDRLYPILCQGLRVQSGTKLQRHGAARGPGVYMAHEPGMAWGYSTVSQGGWKSSNFKNTKILLGCELAGWKPNSASGIQVITDPSRLAVRYIFVLGTNARVPAAKDVRIPMASMFQSFRSTVW